MAKKKEQERLYFVTPYYHQAKRNPDLVPVYLPRELDRFVLIDDPYGFDVMLRYRGRWRPLGGDVWLAKWRDGQAPTYASHTNIVRFGRDILRDRYGAREMSWKDWCAHSRERGGAK